MVDSAGDSSFNSNNNFNNNNNNNNNNVTYKAQIRSGSKCAVSRVSVKQKCFQSLPEGTRGYVLYIIFLILVLLVVGIFYTQINDVSFRIYTSGCSLQLYSHYFHVSNLPFTLYHCLALSCLAFSVVPTAGPVAGCSKLRDH